MDPLKLFILGLVATNLAVTAAHPEPTAEVPYKAPDTPPTGTVLVLASAASANTANTTVVFPQVDAVLGTMLSAPPELPRAKVEQPDSE